MTYFSIYKVLCIIALVRLLALVFSYLYPFMELPMIDKNLNTSHCKCNISFRFFSQNSKEKIEGDLEHNFFRKRGRNN